MADARTITARLTFCPAKAGRDMDQGQIAEWLRQLLEFAPGLDVETVEDGDPRPTMLAALRRVEVVCEDAVIDAQQSGEPDNAAAAQEAWDMVGAAIAQAEGHWLILANQPSAASTNEKGISMPAPSPHG